MNEVEIYTRTCWWWAHRESLRCCWSTRWDKSENLQCPKPMRCEDHRRWSSSQFRPLECLRSFLNWTRKIKFAINLSEQPIKTHWLCRIFCKFSDRPRRTFHIRNSHFDSQRDSERDISSRHDPHIWLFAVADISILLRNAHRQHYSSCWVWWEAIKQHLPPLNTTFNSLIFSAIFHTFSI